MVYTVTDVNRLTFKIGFAYLISLPNYQFSKLLLNFTNAKTKQDMAILNDHLLNTLGIVATIREDRKISADGLSWDTSIDTLYNRLKQKNLTPKEFADYEKICAYCTFCYLTMRNFRTVWSNMKTDVFGVQFPGFNDDKSILDNLLDCQKNFNILPKESLGPPLTNENSALKFFKDTMNTADFKSVSSISLLYKKYLEEIGYLKSLESFSDTESKGIPPKDLPIHLLKREAWETPWFGLIVPEDKSNWTPIRDAETNSVDLNFPSPEVVKVRLADFFRCFFVVVCGRYPQLLNISPQAVDTLLMQQPSRKFLKAMMEAIQGNIANNDVVTSKTFDLKPLAKTPNDASAQNSNGMSNIAIVGVVATIALGGFFLINRNKKNRR